MLLGIAFLLVAANLGVGLWLVNDYTIVDGGLGGRTFYLMSDRPFRLTQKMGAGRHVVFEISGGDATPVERRVLDAKGQPLAVRQGRMNACEVDFFNDEAQELTIEVRRQDGKTDPPLAGWLGDEQTFEKLWHAQRPAACVRRCSAPPPLVPVALKAGPYLKEETFPVRNRDNQVLKDGKDTHHAAYTYPMEAGTTYAIQLSSSHDEVELASSTWTGIALP